MLRSGIDREGSIAPWPEPALLLALLSNKTEPFFAAVTVYNPVCPKNQFLLAKSCTEVYDPQQYLLKLQVTASANSIFLLGIFSLFKSQPYCRVEMVAGILSCAQIFPTSAFLMPGFLLGLKWPKEMHFWQRLIERDHGL